VKNQARYKFKDAVKDHGPHDSLLRLILLLMADFPWRTDGTCWVAVAELARQCDRCTKTVHERLRQLDGVWFTREKVGRKWIYKFRDPGPGASIPTVTQLRNRNAGSAIDTGTVGNEKQNEHDEKGVTTRTASVPPIRSDTSIDVTPEGRPLAQGASVHRLKLERPPAGIVCCPDCGANHVAGRSCDFCARNRGMTTPAEAAG